MEISEATRKAAQILNEERARPTISYAPDTGKDLVTALTRLPLMQTYVEERRRRPRVVHESPDEFRFRGTNYELLLALFSQVSTGDRPSFVAFLVSRWSKLASSSSGDVPLIAEFCIRTGNKEALVDAIQKAPLTLGLVAVLHQLEETIALNFNLFSDDELGRLAKVLSAVSANAYRKTYSSIGPRGGPAAKNPEYDPKIASTAKETVSVCNGLVEECTQARYWYLKGVLQQSANLEVNVDKAKVEGYLKSLGFSGPLLEALNSAEQDFRSTATLFELKSSLGHLRSFMEGLHEQACQPIAAKAGTAAPKKWGKSTEMLRGNALLTVQEEQFATALYALISDEGVHPLFAEREYARLLRNMAIEYGLMFLTKLEKAGINVR
jgi:hypothetical protein